MAWKVRNIRFCNPLKKIYGLTGKFHASSHFSYNFPLTYINTEI